MKKTIAILCVICLGLGIFISGCTQQDNNNGGSTAAKTVTMTAKEYFNDLTTSITDNNFEMLSNSLEDGDTLIINDTIIEVSYDSETDITRISFNASEDGSLNLNLPFEGNITNSYQVGDVVQINTLIKHVQGTYNQATYNLEIFDEMWTGADDYFTQGGALSPTSITKV